MTKTVNKVTDIGGGVRAVSPQVKTGFLARMNQLLGRTGMSQLFGGAFGGKRDYNTVFGYPSVLSNNEIWEMYNRGGIARRVIHAYPDAIWGRPPQLYMPNDPVWNKAWDLLAKKTKLWSYIGKADVLASLGRFSILLIGTTSGTLSSKLRKGSEITFLQPYSERQVSVAKWERDPTNPRYGLPVLYTVQPNNIPSTVQTREGTTTAPSLSSFQVHYSRVLHISHGTMENQVYGTPMYAPIWNYLLDLIKVVGASAESYWMTAYKGMQADVDPEMDLDEEDEADLAAEIDDYQHGLRRFIRTKGVSITDLGSKVADPRGAFEVLLTLISGTTAIPKRILLGSEAGQLASSQDKGNWAERVEEKRANYAEPEVIMQFLHWANEYGILETDLDNVQVLWPDAYRMSPLERAQQGAQTARTIANIQKGLQPVILVPAEVPVTGPDGVTSPGKPAELGEPLITHQEARKIIGLSTDQQILIESPI
jgi:uncharacterized protein